MERLRSIKITVEVDTNKMTYEKEFDDVDDMLVWLDGLELGICPTQRAVDVVTCAACEVTFTPSVACPSCGSIAPQHH